MEEDKYKEELEVRSTEVQEVLTYVPNWMIRWGITVFFVTIVLLLVSSWFIKYPQVITSQITVTPGNPPVRLVSKSAGKVHFFVKDGDQVKEGTVLAYLENAGNVRDVLLLRNFVLNDKVDSINPEIFKNSERNLGDVAPSFNAFRKALENYREYQSRDYFSEKISNLKKQVQYHKDLESRLQKQEEIAKDVFDVAQSSFERSTRLKDQKVISENEWELGKRDYLTAKKALENAGVTRVNNKIQISELDRRITDLEQELNFQMRDVRLELDKARESLYSSISLWENSFLLVAPVDGELAFFGIWSDNQHVLAGQEVMSVVPKSESIVGKILLPINGSGKVEIGQRVNIKFAGYPFNEFGAVHGKVRRINPVQQNNAFLIDVELPDGLKTSYGITLEDTRELQGTAEIITKDLRLIDRLFNQIRYLFTSNV